MVKFFGLIPRRPDLSVEEFHDHYRHSHGALGKRIPGFRGYVQSHQFASPLLGNDREFCHERASRVAPMSRGDG